MSKVLIRKRTEDGSTMRYRCPRCGHYRSRDELLWERPPGDGDPGKIDRCRRCGPATRAERAVMELNRKTEIPLRFPL